MDFREFSGNYLSSRKIWVTGIITVLAFNLVSVGLNFGLGFERNALYVALVEFLFLALGVYYLEGAEVDVPGDKSLSVAFTFAAISALMLAVSGIGSAVMVLEWLPRVVVGGAMGVPEMFLVVLGLYYLYEDFDRGMFDRAAGSVLASLAIIFGLYMSFYGALTISGSVRFLMAPEIVRNTLNAFFMLFAVFKGVREFTSYRDRELAGILTVFGVLTALLNYLGDLSFTWLKPEYGELLMSSNLFYIAPLIISISGMVYYLYGSLKESRNQLFSL